MFGKVLVGVAALFALFLIVGHLLPQPDPNSPAQRATFARENCREFIRRQLHDPGSAEWGTYLRWPAVPKDGGVIEVVATLRAQNAFGGMVQAIYSCVVLQDGRNSRLVSLTQL